MHEEIRPQVAAFAAAHGRPPGLGIVLVGDDPASDVYVQQAQGGRGVGFLADCARIPETATLDEVLAAVDRLNREPVHDGILVQSPLPKAMGAGRDPACVRRDCGRQGRRWLRRRERRPAVAEPRDAGGVHAGRRHRAAGARGFADCRQRAVVLGRSDIVGKPMALLLLHRDATVTICHSRTPDLAATCRQADILVAAIGQPGFVTAGIRQARRHRGGRGHQPGHRCAARGVALPAGAHPAGQLRHERDACSSATCTRTSRRLPAR